MIWHLPENRPVYSHVSDRLQHRQTLLREEKEKTLRKRKDSFYRPRRIYSVSPLISCQTSSGRRLTTSEITAEESELLSLSLEKRGTMLVFVHIALPAPTNDLASPVLSLS